MESNTCNKKKEYLPLGSVVLLNEGKKMLMIYGRLQRDEKTNTIYDYIACLYPEGHLGRGHSIVFNHENINQVIYEGFSNETDKLWMDILAKEDKRINLK